MEINIMFHRKNIHSTLLSLCSLSVIGLHADSKSFGPGFSLMNKSDSPITAYVYNGTDAHDMAKIKQLLEDVPNLKGFDRDYNLIYVKPFVKEDSAPVKTSKKLAQKVQNKLAPVIPFIEAKEIEEEIQGPKIIEGGYVSPYSKNIPAPRELTKKDLFYNKNINWQKPTTVFIFDENGTLIYAANIKADHTIYVHWDGKKLYPQRGPHYGIGLENKTDLGYPLDKNVSTKHIVELKNLGRYNLNGN